MRQENLSAFDAGSISSAIERIKHSFGEELFKIYSDPALMEMMYNCDGKLFYQMIGSSPIEYPEYVNPAKIERIIKIASHLAGVELTASNPILETVLPFDGARFSATIPPVTALPTFSVRKKAIRIFSLQEYFETGVITKNQWDVIRKAVKEHANIIVAGSTGSGKTTFCNAVIREISDQYPNERIILIQDVPELQCASKNYVDLISNQYTTPTQLVKLSLRYKPTRIFMGEVRDSVCLDLMDLWNTGHEGGVSTVHANTALSTLTRLENLIERNQFAPKRIPEVIAETLNYVFFINIEEDGKRKLSEILRIDGYDKSNSEYIYTKM